MLTHVSASAAGLLGWAADATTAAMRPRSSRPERASSMRKRRYAAA